MLTTSPSTCQRHSGSLSLSNPFHARFSASASSPERLCASDAGSCAWYVLLRSVRMQPESQDKLCCCTRVCTYGAAARRTGLRRTLTCWSLPPLLGLREITQSFFPVPDKRVLAPGRVTYGDMTPSAAREKTGFLACYRPCFPHSLAALSCSLVSRLPYCLVRSSAQVPVLLGGPVVRSFVCRAGCVRHASRSPPCCWVPKCVSCTGIILL